MQNKTARPLAATSGDDVSYLNLFNPLSPIMGGGDKYPTFMADMFPGNPRAAWLVSKIGAVGLLAAAVFGTARGVQHMHRMSDMRDEDDPGKDMRTQLSTTFEGSLGKHAGLEQTIPMPSSVSLDNVTNTALPLGAFLLASVLAWNGADKLADSRRNRLLQESIDRKYGTVKDLIQLRARVAKGNATKEEVAAALAAANDDDNYVKIASSDDDAHPTIRKGITSLGLIVAALCAASGIGAYRYLSEANPNNIKYKAIEKGLKDYARNRAYNTPVALIPDDAAEYFSGIDSNGEELAESDVREQPEAAESRRPISVTL